MKKNLFGRILVFVLALAMLMSSFSICLTVSAEDNLALGRPVIASHTESDTYSANKAVDGDKSTRWASNVEELGPSDQRWICVDLGAIYDLSKISIAWEAAYAKSYSIQVSNDYGDFTTIYSTDNASGGTENLNVSGKGRYVRIVASSYFYPQYGCSIYELEVYGTLSADQSADKDTVKITGYQNEKVFFLPEKGEWAKDGETVSAFVKPFDNYTITKITANGVDITSSYSGDIVTFTVNGDTNLEFTLSRISNKFEAENAGRIGDWDVQNDENASNGKVAGQTGGQSFIFTDVPQSNKIMLAYASTYSSTIDVYILENGDYVKSGVIGFATTQAWTMDTGKTTYSGAIYIPEGATIKLIPAQDVNMDYIVFLTEPITSEEDVPENTVLAKNSAMSEGIEIAEDYMSTVGSVAKLTEKGQSVTFTVPDGDFNTYNLKYRTDKNSSVEINFGDRRDTYILNAGRPHYYSSFGEKEISLAANGRITVTMLEDGELYLDSITFSKAMETTPAPEITLPASGERVEVNLDGIWECTNGDNIVDASSMSVPDKMEFNNSIPVPGLWDLASIDMGDYNGASLWYRKTIEMPDDFSGDSCDVTLQILRAGWGRSIYVNGQFVETYEYNFSNSNTDITKYLVPGENEIVIAVGNINQQKNDPDCVGHVLVDYEKTDYPQGIYDSVNIILNRTPEVASIQTAANIDNSTVQTRIKLENNSSADVTTDVNIEIYELGVFKNGVATQEKKLVGTYTENDVTVSAEGTAQVDIDAIDVADFEKSAKAWCPQNPFLYEIKVTTSGDTFSKRFAMRTFTYDKETKLPMLNGEVYYLRGTNVPLFRFYEDPSRGDHPWDEEWIRTLYQQFKSINWEVLRFHVGMATSQWYDIADEEGYMIADEYAIWGTCYDGCTLETLVPEIHAIIDEKQTHASIINWDMQNEGRDIALTGEMILHILEEGYDIDTGRVWDNGWAPAPNTTTTIECHPYLFSNTSFQLSNLNDLSKLTFDELRGNFNSGANNYNNTNPIFINEYGWLWLDRNGDPTPLTKAYYDKWMPGSTREERLEFYAEALAQVTEFWRATRGMSGILQFSGLSYSKPGGATSDVLLPDLTTPEIRPYTKELFRCAFARLGIVVENYSTEAQPGKEMIFPVTLINDYNNNIENLDVKFTVYKGDEILYTETKSYSVNAAGAADGSDLKTQEFTYQIPERKNIKDGEELLIIAEYNYNGENIYSQRKLKIDYSLTDPVSIGKPAEAKSFALSDDGTEYRYASKATDGNTATRWGSDWKNGDDTDSWLTVDLEDIYDINKVNISWEGAYAQSYEIQISDDNVSFTTIYSTKNGTGGNETIDLSGTGRYVRINLSSPATSYGFSIWEFTVYGELHSDPVQIIAPENVIRYEQFEVTVISQNDFENLTLYNENDMKVSSKITSKSIDENGVVTTVISLNVGTAGNGRTLRVFLDGEESGSFTFDAEDITDGIYGLEAPSSVNANEKFNVTVLTTSLVTKYKFTNEKGNTIGSRLVSKTVSNGFRTSVYDISIGTKGDGRVITFNADYDKRNDFPFSRDFTIDVM